MGNQRADCSISRWNVSSTESLHTRTAKYELHTMKRGLYAFANSIDSGQPTQSEGLPLAIRFADATGQPLTCGHGSYRDWLS